VRRIDPTATIFPFAGQGYVEGFAGDGGPATAASLDTPLRTAVSSTGDVFIADFNNNRIRRVDATGTITTFAAGINQPAALVFGADGTLYVAEFGGERILTVDAGGGVHPFAGTGGRSTSLANAGDGGPVGEATFADPTGSRSTRTARSSSRIRGTTRSAGSRSTAPGTSRPRRS
jgi:sugar lactone lactonase YvrE